MTDTDGRMEQLLAQVRAALDLPQAQQAGALHALTEEWGREVVAAARDVVGTRHALGDMQHTTNTTRKETGR
ncbi:hypothetical protein [Actinacidiphila yeochonensis]|uniref:hypothetical protein n=1 Tax=Actinacidiphila yeochonensis TaxID=89050 RepID=UPI0005656D50|nr:hypothetical protein [Actinacidiphila yeochonensis]